MPTLASPGPSPKAMTWNALLISSPLPCESGGTVIGKGTTGLGQSCNEALHRDKERRIREYNKRKDDERTAAVRDANRFVSLKDRKGQSTRSELSLAQKIEQQKQLRREQLVQERRQMEEELREDKMRVAQIKREEVEKERHETRARKDRQRQIRLAFEQERRDKLVEEVKEDRAFLKREEAAAVAEVELRHCYLKDMRDLCKQRAVEEKALYQDKFKRDIERQKKKLAAMQVEHKSLADGNLEARKENIRTERKDRVKKSEKRKITEEHEHEQLQKSLLEEKETLAAQLREREERRMEETKRYIRELKESRKRAYEDSLSHRPRVAMTPTFGVRTLSPMGGHPRAVSAMG